MKCLCCEGKQTLLHLPFSQPFEVNNIDLHQKVPVNLIQRPISEKNIHCRAKQKSKGIHVLEEIHAVEAKFIFHYENSGLLALCLHSKKVMSRSYNLYETSKNLKIWMSK